MHKAGCGTIPDYKDACVGLNMSEDSQALMVLYGALPYGLKSRIRTLLLALGKNLPRGLRVPLGGVVAAFLYSKNLAEQMNALRVSVVKQWKARLDECIEEQARRVVDSVVCEGYDKVTKGGIEKLFQSIVKMSRSVSIEPYFELSVTRQGYTHYKNWDDYVMHNLLRHMKARVAQLGVRTSYCCVERQKNQHPTEGSSVTFNVGFEVIIRREADKLEDIFTFD
eukprot:Hpha_TRINITY_DN15786_c2_g9::TRINITY_DN15786_c2_g9_i2::g.37451::m.37451